MVAPKMTFLTDETLLGQVFPLFEWGEMTMQKEKVDAPSYLSEPFYC
jgi:hypothetical protein